MCIFLRANTETKTSITYCALGTSDKGMLTVELTSKLAIAEMIYISNVPLYHAIVYFFCIFYCKLLVVGPDQIICPPVSRALVYY